ncbi:MAG: hypothetical protein MZV63_20725 [Marinilabiliales bacterium]|nr:hypothetical protein [Marinilabiliales bacterium]
MLEETLSLISIGKIQMLGYPDFFEAGYKFKWDKDVSHYLDKVADKDEAGQAQRCMPQDRQGDGGDLQTEING